MSAPEFLKTLTIFIASPGDVNDERQIAREVIEHLNKRPWISKKFLLRTEMYEDAPPHMGLPTQEAVNYWKQSNECDLFVLILWNRIGQKVRVGDKEYDSGSMYEFESAYDAYKLDRRPFHVFFYRCNRSKPTTNNPEDYLQAGLVAKFVRDIEQGTKFEGTYKPFDTSENFRTIFETDLEQVIVDFSEKYDIKPSNLTSPLIKEHITPDNTLTLAESNLTLEPSWRQHFPWDQFISLSEWEQLPDLYLTSISYHEDASRQDAFQQFESWFKSEKQILRIVGRTGVGKTRFSLEATRKLDLSRSVLYLTSARNLTPDFFNKLVLSQKLELILVVDACSDIDFQFLSTSVKRVGARTRLICIQSIAKYGTKDEDTISVEPLNSDAISNIIRNLYEFHGVSTNGNDKAAYASDYSPFDLTLLIEFVISLLKNPTIGGIAELTFVDSLQRAIKRRLPEDHFKVRALQILSFIDASDLPKQRKQFGEYLAGLIGLNEYEYAICVEELKKEYGSFIDNHREIFHLGNLLSVHMSYFLWKSIGQDLIANHFRDLSEKDLINFRLIILDSLSYLGDRHFAEALLNPILDRFDSIQEISENLEVFSALGKAAPILTVRHLENILEKCELEELRQHLQQNSSLISMLEQSLKMKQCSISAARSIAFIAAIEPSETERHSKNAVRIWKSIFFMRLAQNPIDSSNRIRLIKELATASQEALRQMAVTAIEGVLDNFEMGALTRSPGGYIGDSGWFPQTWKDFWDVRKLVLPLLVKLVEDEALSVRNKALNCLFEYARHQVPVLISDILKIMNDLPMTPELQINIWNTLSTILQYDKDKLSPEQYREIEQTKNTLINNEYRSELLFYVVNPQIETHVYSDERMRELNEKLDSLINKALSDPKLLQQELSWLSECEIVFGGRLYRFWQRLGQLDSNARFWYQSLTETSRLKNVPLIIEAYLRGRIDAGDQNWVQNEVKTLFNELVRSENYE